VTIPSDLPLTDTDRSVLSKGLSFIPTPEPDELQCKEDVRKFFRRIRLHAHFNDPNKPISSDALDDDTTSLFARFAPKKSSSWTPHTSPQAVEDFISRCQNDINNLTFTRRSSSNLQRQAQKSLMELSHRNDVVIRPADKGGATVVWQK